MTGFGAELGGEPQPRGANPFGYVDHSAFGGFGADLVYGLRDDGAHIHVSGVPSGLACKCVCPACGRPLVARKGTKKVAHFAHYGAGNGCGRGAETNAHIWAKEVLQREKRILLPAVEARIDKERFQLHASGMFRFAEAHLEKALGDIVPDVILTTSDGRRLLVEVLVTHACGPEKIEKLRSEALPTIEVDLSAWRTSADKMAIELALLEKGPRAWLYNQKTGVAEERLREQIAKREEAIAEGKKRAAAKAQRDTDNAVSSLLRAAGRAGSYKSQAGMDALRRLELIEQFDVLDPKITGIGFRVPPRQWQAIIYSRMVSPPYAGELILPHLSVEQVLRALGEDVVDPAFLQKPSDSVRRGLRARQASARLPREAIDDYLSMLCMQGYLQATGFDSYELSDDQAEALETLHAHRQAAGRRQRAVDRSMESILRAIPSDILEAFDLDAWRRRALPGYTHSLEIIVEDGGPAWDKLNAALLAIEKMIAGGEVVEDLLGLPLKEVAWAVADATRLRLEKEAQARGALLRNTAQSLLEDEALAWLSRTDAQGLTPLAASEASQAGLDRALSAVERAAEARIERKRTEARITAVRDKLKQAAERDLGAELGGLFLKLHDPRLGAVPSQYCVDEHSLSECLRVLALSKGRVKGPRRRS